jgi:hypothetical protein
MDGITFNHYMDIGKISIQKYIYMDGIYDYDEILFNISQKTEGGTRKRKRSINDYEVEEEFNRS